MEKTDLKKDQRTVKKNRAMKIILTIIALIIAARIAASMKLAESIMNGTRQSLEQAMAWQKDHYDTSFYDELETEKYTVEGHDGYVLNAELLKNPNHDGRYIIISHGYTDNRYGSLKYAKLYLDLGYSCIIYDLRGHGENKTTYTSYGLLEGKDLKALVDDTWERYSDIRQLGLHGESLGAASTITSLKYSPKVDFVVADCGFSDIVRVLKNGVKMGEGPEFIIDIASFGAKLRYGYALSDMRPIDALDENTVPILFLHGAEDMFITPDNSKDMYERTKGKKELHLIEGAGHAESILKDPETYGQYVREFLDSL